MIKKCCLKLIKTYQQFVSPLTRRCCRFYPSCSQYCFLAIKKHGVLKGVFLGTKRILRCHPLSKGGIDLP
jgi:uncharacterized protein